MKENAKLIKHFGPMYIDFDDYPSYSSALSENFETYISAHILCDKGYAYSTIKDNMLTWISKEI